MAEDRLKIWQILFQRALALIDSVTESGTVFEPWSFGGGTVLMRKYRHRFSKDIDSFAVREETLAPRKTIQGKRYVRSCAGSRKGARRS